MFGGLVLVDSPVLVERYKRALKHLTGTETALQDFHIDISGFSPEIGDELGDDHYLNPPGFNRQFILLGTEQKKAPLLNARFSTSRGILRQFIEANEAELFALTARDAVAGELVNSVYAADAPARLFDIRKVTVEADTTQGTVATAERLTGLIDRFKSEPDAWWDDALIGEMIQLAGVTGDLTRNPVRLRAMSFEQDDFWTSHFGGLYVFRSVPQPGAIAAGDKDDLGPLPIPEVLDLGDRTAIASFLARNELVEPIVSGRSAEVAALLRQKMDFIVADVAGAEGRLAEGTTRRDLRTLARRYAGRLPPEWEGLAALVAWAEEGARWPRITSDHPAYFYTLRARRTPVADIVNMLLAELAPLDVRQLFICHKEAFYRLYRGWPEGKQAYVADALAQEYMVDKAGTREALFGPDAPMEEPVVPTAGPWGRPAEPRPAPAGEPRDLVDRVGPWGAVRRR
nr:DUF6638 family protein [Rubellimicrobium arenae]